MEKIIPMTYVGRFHHTKKTSINSLDIDNNDNHFETRSSDGAVKIWNFNSLTLRPKSNHSVDCSEEKENSLLYQYHGLTQVDYF